VSHGQNHLCAGVGRDWCRGVFADESATIDRRRHVVGAIVINPSAGFAARRSAFRRWVGAGARRDIHTRRRFAVRL